MTNGQSATATAIPAILLTNYCVYDCQYCVNRISSDVERAKFEPEEVVTLTLDFYRRNYIEGLFLSSGVFKSPDYTMERLTRVAKLLREQHQFGGYIHLKTVPGADALLLREAGRYADRLSANLELVTRPIWRGSRRKKRARTSMARCTRSRRRSCRRKKTEGRAAHASPRMAACSGVGRTRLRRPVRARRSSWARRRPAIARSSVLRARRTARTSCGAYITRRSARSRTPIRACRCGRHRWSASTACTKRIG